MNLGASGSCRIGSKHRTSNAQLQTQENFDVRCWMLGVGCWVLGVVFE